MANGEKVKGEKKEMKTILRIFSALCLAPLIVVSLIMSLALPVAPSVAANGTGAVCPAGNVKYEVGSGYEYTDGSVTITGDANQICWSVTPGYDLTGLCIKEGGPEGGSLIDPCGGPCPDNGCAGPYEYGISHAVGYTVEEVPEEPACTGWSVSPATGTVPLDVLGNGSFTDPDSQVTSTFVEWGDSSSTPTALNPTSVPHTYGVGTFTSQLVLVKTGGTEIRDPACQDTVEVGEEVPEEPVCTGWSVSPNAGTAPLDVIGNGSFTDPDSQITSTFVEWGDSSQTATALNPTNVPHTYGVGTFTSQLVLVKTDGTEIRDDACQDTVEVSEKPPEEPGCFLEVLKIVHDPAITLRAQWWNGTPGPHPLDWDDGNISQLFGVSGNEVLSHEYRESGIREIVFTVYGEGNQTAVCRTTIEFREEVECPTPAYQVEVVFDLGPVQIYQIDHWNFAAGTPIIDDNGDYIHSNWQNPGPCPEDACKIQPQAGIWKFAQSVHQMLANGQLDPYGQYWLVVTRHDNNTGWTVLGLVRPMVTPEAFKMEIYPVVRWFVEFWPGDTNSYDHLWYQMIRFEDLGRLGLR